MPSPQTAGGHRGALKTARAASLWPWKDALPQGLERPELADPQILKTEKELMEKRLFKIRRDRDTENEQVSLSVMWALQVQV